MLPRADKFYVTLIVGFSVVVVIVSIIAAIAAFSGDSTERPAYESAPDPSLVQLPPETLMQNAGDTGIVQAELETPPIGDDTFLLLHSSTRQLLQALSSSNPMVELQKAGLSPKTSYRLLNQAKGAKNYVRATGRMTPAGKIKVVVKDLSLVQNPSKQRQVRSIQVDTSANQDYVLVGNDGCRLSQIFQTSVDIHWTLPLDSKGQPAGRWDMEPRFTMPVPDPNNSGC
jgi:hypothetical protein